MTRALFVLPDGREIFSGVGAVPAIQSVNVTESVNTQTDMTLGAACAAMVEVTLLDTSGEFVLPAGEEIAYYEVIEDETRTLVGRFLPETPSKPSAYTYKFTAYDRMILADVDVTDWLAGLTGWPYTIRQLLDMVCAQCGLELEDGPELINGDYEVDQFWMKVTGRQLISYIAEANGCFARMNAEGKLDFGFFESTGTVIEPQEQKSLAVADYVTAPIDRVAVRKTQDDVGVAWPQDGEGELYEIVCNPLLVTDSKTDILPCVQRLQQKLQGFSYTPAKAQLFHTDVRAGQLLTLRGRNGAEYITAIFSVTRRSGISTIESTGNRSRTSAAAMNNQNQIKVLQGKMTEVISSIDGIAIRVSATEMATAENKNSIKAVDELKKEAIVKPKIAGQNSSVVSISNVLTDGFASLRVFGKTAQKGSPRPDFPQELESVGDSGEINIAVGGKNLVSFAENVSTETYMNGYDRWSEDWIIPDGIKGKTITYSALLKCSAGSSSASAVSIWYQCSADDSLRHYGHGTYIGAGEEGISYKTIDVSDDWYSIAFGVYLHGASDDPATASRGMVEIGSVATEYEPYKAQTISASTPNGLPGIPVESGGNYTDSNGQQWICDEKDFARGVYVQRVGRRVFDGSENWSAFGSAYPHLFVIYNIFTTGQKTFLSTAYPYYAGKYNESMAYFMSDGAGGFAVNDIRFTTLGEFIGHLAERPLEVLYALVTPIETPLSAEEMEQYASLSASKPITTIWNACGADLEVELSGFASEASVRHIGEQVTEVEANVEGVAIRVSATESVTAENQNATKKLQEEVGKVEADVQTRATVQQLTEVKAAADGLRVSVSKVETTLGDKADKAAVEEITEHFRFAGDGLTITNTGNGMGIGVSEKRVIFTGGQDPTTVITPNAMETTNLAVGQRLDVGGFSWIPRSNGNLSFRYTGGG